MGYPGGYGNFGGNGYVSPFQFVPPTGPGLFSYTPFEPFRPDVVAINGTQGHVVPPKKTGFFQGFAQAAQSAFQMLTTAKGLAIVGALYGAKLALGPAFAALLLMGATGDGVYKFVKGLLHQNANESGNGFFTLLVPALFLIFGSRFGLSLPAASSRLLGKTYHLVTQEGETVNLGHRLKAIFGMCHYRGPDGKTINAYALHQVRLRDWWQRLIPAAAK